MNALVKFGFYEAPLQSCCDFLIKDLLKRDADLIEEPENPEGKEAYWFLVEDGEGERKSRVCCEPPEENSKSVIIFGKNKELNTRQTTATTTTTTAKTTKTLIQEIRS